MIPYYQDKWVTIYHLTSKPMCDNLLLDDCTEVNKWIIKNELGDTEQDYEERTYRNKALGQERDTNRHQSTHRNANGLGQSITHIKAKISLLNLGEAELYVAIQSDLVKDVIIQNLRDTIRMGLQEIIAQRIFGSYAEDAICLRMED